MDIKDVCIFAGAYYYGHKGAAFRGDWWNSTDEFMYRCYDHDKKMTKTLKELCEGCPNYAPYKKFFIKSKIAQKKR